MNCIILIYLNGCRFGIVGHLDVGLDDGGEVHVVKAVDPFGHVRAGSLHRDILVPV